MKRFLVLFATLLVAVSSAYAEPKINKIETIVKDTRGSILTDAFCAIYAKYGSPYTFVSDSQGEAFLIGEVGSIIRCVKDKNLYEMPFPSGTPTQILMKPIIEGSSSCAVYNVLPNTMAHHGCYFDKDCKWNGFDEMEVGACTGEAKVKS